MLTLLINTSSIVELLVFINLIRDSPTVESLIVRPLTTSFSTDDTETREADMLDPSIERFAIVTDLQELARTTAMVLEN